MRWRSLEHLLPHDDPDSIFCRIVLVDDITPILDKEQSELAECLALARASQDYEPIPYLDDAMKSLQERREAFAAKQAGAKQPAIASSVRCYGLLQFMVAHVCSGPQMPDPAHNSSVWTDSEGDEENVRIICPSPFHN